MTSGGEKALKCFHSITPWATSDIEGNLQLIKDIVLKILTLCETENLKSVVFLPMGTGAGGISIELFSKAFTEAFFLFFKNGHVTCLNEVFMAIPEYEKLNVFVEVISEKEILYEFYSEASKD